MSAEQSSPTVEDLSVTHGEDPVRSWTWLGNKAADWLGTVPPTKLASLTFLPGRALKDADYLRGALGNIWLLFPVLGIAGGVVAAVNAEGLPLPPATGIFLFLMILGIFDAFAGLLAFLVFLIAVAVTGHLDSLHAVSGLFGLGVIWFGGSMVAHQFRPVGLWDAEPTTSMRAWRIGGDIIILPAIGAFILGKVTTIFTYLTGYQVPIANKGTLVTIVAVGCLAARAAAQSAVLHNYRNRLASMPRSTLFTRGEVATFVGFVVRGFVAYVVIWSFLGNQAPTWIVWVLFMSFEPIGYLGTRFPDSTVLRRFVPRNLLKITVIVLVAELILLWIQPHFHTTQALMGWTFVILSAFAVALLILEQFKGEDWPEVWITRILGAISIVFFVLVVFGVLKIS